MASIMTGSVDVTKITKSKIAKGKYLPLTFVSNDEVGQYGDSGYIAEGQTKEERDAKVAKTYLGNGKVVWTDGTVKLAEREEQAAVAVDEQSGDLPF